MPEGGKITYKQLILLIIISRIIITITYHAAINSPPENQDLWISMLLSFPIILFFSLPVYLLWKRFPNLTIIQYSGEILGIAGKLTGVFYVWFFIHLAAINLIQLGEFFTTAIMPETPILFFVVSLTLFCAYAVRSGIEVIGRMCEIIVPIVLIAIISIFLLLLKDMDLKALTPVMEKGFFSVLHGGFTITARTYEILELAMLFPYLNNQKKVKTVFILGFSVIIIVLLLITIPIITVFGVELAKTRTLPYFSAVRLVSVGDFIEHIETIHLGIWVFGIFIKVSILYYLAVLGMSQILNLKDYKPLVLPTGTILVPLSILIAPSIVELREFTSYKIVTWYILFFVLFIPSILLITSIIRGKGEKKR